MIVVAELVTRKQSLFGPWTWPVAAFLCFCLSHFVILSVGTGTGLGVDINTGVGAQYAKKKKLRL